MREEKVLASVRGLTVPGDKDFWGLWEGGTRCHLPDSRHLGGEERGDDGLWEPTGFSDFHHSPASKNPPKLGSPALFNARLQKEGPRLPENPAPRKRPNTWTIAQPPPHQATLSWGLLGCPQLAARTLPTPAHRQTHPLSLAGRPRSPLDTVHEAPPGAAWIFPPRLPQGLHSNSPPEFEIPRRPITSRPLFRVCAVTHRTRPSPGAGPGNGTEHACCHSDAKGSHV